ncbi:MAG: hypothetical protein R6U27_09175 [Desulfobacterales bacterium]
MSEHKVADNKALEPFLEALEKIFAAMNAKYDEAASHYGFYCNGCDENCCKTLFYHHTYLEFFYLKNGLHHLSSNLKEHVFTRAVEVCDDLAKTFNRKNEQPRVMCPANVEGKCVIYDYRPMICRLHGIPSEWTFPAKTGRNQTVVSSGCEEFSRQCYNKEYFKFDRTPFYMDMSRLEKQLREKFSLNQKIKMTVAQILVCENVPF